MTSSLPRRPVGSTPSAQFFQWVYDSLCSSKIIGGPGVRVSRTTRGTIIEAAKSESVAGGGDVSQYVLTDASPGDYFVARTLAADGTCGTDDIYIAKPWSLRKSALDGLTESVEVELLDGTDLTTETRTYEYDYKSATLRIKTDTTDPDNPLNETQGIIPRFVPGTVEVDPDSEEETPPLIATNDGATVLYAIDCSDLDVVGPGDVAITKLCLNDGWAWAYLQ